MTDFTNNILKWYNQNHILFPWRETSDPYKIWLSEIMLQQTQVQTVIPFYNRWIKKFPTIYDVAKSSDEELFKYWEGLGYYNRANNFREACIQVINQYNGEIPDNKIDLLQLKGIGDYTSSAISSIAFNKPNYVIDGNVKRIMARILCLPDYSKTSFNKINKFLITNINKNKPGDFNQSLMDLGREICKPKNPICKDCPISFSCKSYLTNQVSKYPINNKPKSIKPHYKVGVGIIWNKNKILITKRKKNGLLGGLWEFPGGKVLNNESITKCIHREIKEELNIQVNVEAFITNIKHQYSHFSIDLYAHHCFYNGGKIKCTSADDWKWVSPKMFSKYPFPKANHYIFPHILDKQTI